VATGRRAGRDEYKVPFFNFFIAASIRPVDSGLRSSSAELMASTCALVFSISGSGL